MKKNAQKRVILTFAIFIIFALLVFLSWRFSAQSACQSNQLSMRIAEKITNGLDKYFEINRSDVFWTITFNELIRKAAHFLEYIVIGCVMCLMFNVAINRALLAALISTLISPVLGIIDEYHQRFSSLRTPRILDICIDTAGVLTGIIIITLIFLVYNRIKKLKARIKELEEQNP